MILTQNADEKTAPCFSQFVTPQQQQTQRLGLQESDVVSRRSRLESVDTASDESTESSVVLNEDRAMDVWLNTLAITAELETMSILYAKSVLDPAASSQLGASRVAISCKKGIPNDTKSEKPQNDDHNENCQGKHRINESSSSDSALSDKASPLPEFHQLLAETVMQQQAISSRILRENQKQAPSRLASSLSSSVSESPSSNDVGENEVLETTPRFAQTHNAIDTRMLDATKTTIAPTRFSLSLSSAETAQRWRNERISTIPINTNKTLAQQVASLNKCDSRPGPSSAEPTSSSYFNQQQQAPPLAVVYRPKVELRSTRRQKLTASAALARRSVGAVLAQNMPPTFRHSIRVNAEEYPDSYAGVPFSQGPYQSALNTKYVTHASSQRQDACIENRIYETISEATPTLFYHQNHSTQKRNLYEVKHRSRYCGSADLSPSRSSSDGTADSGQGSAGSLLVTATTVMAGANLSPPLPPRRPHISPSLLTDAIDSSSGAACKNILPGYIRVASCLDQILRSASTLNTVLHLASSRFGSETANGGALRFSIVGERGARDLLDSTLFFIRLVRETTCAPYFYKSLEFESVERIARRFDQHNHGGMNVANTLSARDHFVVVAHQMLEHSMLVFVHIICDYLNDCDSTESLLPIALEHFIQTLLFGDDVCLDAVKCGAVERIVWLIRDVTTPMATRRLLLRALAMLCATSRGCLQLLVLDDGLDTIIQTLCTTSEESTNSADIDAMSVEAAGVLTQLTRPSHALIALSDKCVGSCVRRLLNLVDAQQHRVFSGQNDVHEALLLCCASLANLSLKGNDVCTDVASSINVTPEITSHNGSALVAQLLYEHNAPRRLISAVNALRNRRVKQKFVNSPLFVQEQVVTVLSRMASRGYSQALIAQAAIPFLLNIFGDCADVNSANISPSNRNETSMVASTYVSRRQSAEFYRRLCYKSAVCLGILAASSAGLKSLYESRGYNELCDVLRINSAGGSASPLTLICASLKQRLESTYQVESAV